MIRFYCIALSLALVPSSFAPNAFAQPPLSPSAKDAQSRVVKIYGAGGLSGLEAYQSGFLVSPDGHVATAWSYVLDVEPYVVLTMDAVSSPKLLGSSPRWSWRC